MSGPRRVVRVKATDDSSKWPVVYSFKDPTKGWDEYEGMYVYPTIKMASRFCLHNVEVTRLHYYVVNPTTDRVIVEYHPKPVRIAPQAPIIAKKNTNRKASK